MLYKFECDGHTAVYAEDHSLAAKLIARRKASRLGLRGRVATLQQSSVSRCGEYSTWQAYIGVYDKHTKTVIGDNQFFVMKQITQN